ncbi:hypothetical protein SLE2022_015190 [Rubroshorea leprosula]
MIRDILIIPKSHPRRFTHGGENEFAGLAEETLVVPNHGLFLNRATLSHVTGSKNDTISTNSGRDVTAAEEETVHPVGSFSGGRIIEPIGGSGGVGREGKEKVFEIGLVSTVCRESGGVGAEMAEVSWSVLSFRGKAEQVE